MSIPPPFFILAAVIILLAILGHVYPPFGLEREKFGVTCYFVGRTWRTTHLGDSRRQLRGRLVRSPGGFVL
jgi:hypothetical protein